MNNLIEDKDKIYHKALTRFSSAQFDVFYDGNEYQSRERQMCLSETFTDSNSALELVVTALNINHELPQLLFEKCRYLEQQDKAICAGYEDGRDDGISEGIESVAVNIIQYGEPIKKILEFTKLSVERIKKFGRMQKRLYTYLIIGYTLITVQPIFMFYQAVLFMVGRKFL